jgi:hypothetical protein
MPQNEDHDLTFQLHDVHPHFGCTVHESLKRNFLGSWIRRPGPWPCRSLDLTPLDFYFQNYVKDYTFLKK